ncbi:hypothetical protein [Flavisphingomonas formosensis]|uniref:hypothetical protein n=1 Tax=Flavisphingomonas formosensis TaxID=861534 RepID=UPI0012FB5598|nr:hypothetical protein [Sphingomonas formosensis]
MRVAYDGGSPAAELESAAAALWAGLAFDEAAKAALRRDGLAVEAIRLTGPCPFRLRAVDAAHIAVSVPGRSDAAALLDLWQVYFQRRVAPPGGQQAA